MHGPYNTAFRASGGRRRRPFRRIRTGRDRPNKILRSLFKFIGRFDDRTENIVVPSKCRSPVFTRVSTFPHKLYRYPVNARPVNCTCAPHGADRARNSDMLVRKQRRVSCITQRHVISLVMMFSTYVDRKHAVLKNIRRPSGVRSNNNNDNTISVFDILL